MLYIANCKINIGLNIINKREDGFHNLSTIMYPLSGLSDVVEVVHSDEFRFTSSGLEVDCSGDNNLCVKAYKLISERYKMDSSVHIHLHKSVPFGAGLGGGSSDASFTLKAINELKNLGLSGLELKEMAAELGSDTAFFIDNTPQICSGRGEITQQVSLSLKGYYITVVKPPLYISTKEAFSGITPKESDFNMQDILSLDISSWRDVIVNDFEEHLFRSHISLQQIKDKFYELGAIYCSLSGSGSALYAISSHPIERKYFDKEYFFCSYLEK